MQKKQTPFWLFILAVLFALILPVLVQDGMFLDGILYANISRNLADGIGSFWALRFCPSHSEVFKGHPPLAFGIQSLFFKSLGSSMYTERIYSFFTFCIVLILISFLWKRIFSKNEPVKKIAWLPCLLWGITPLVFWSYANNMLENTMSIFTLLACLFILKSANKNTPAIYLSVAGMFIFLGTLSKGLPALFPIAIPVWMWIINRKPFFIKSIVYSFLILAVISLLYTIVLAYEPARTAIIGYINHQVIHSIKSDSTVDSRLYIIQRLMIELAFPLLAASILWVYSKWRKPIILPSEELKKYAFLFFLIGLSASLPIMITLKQSGYYLVPSFPFFAIGFACLFSPLTIRITDPIINSSVKYSVTLFTSCLLFAGTILFSVLQIGKTSRDKDMLHDVYLIGKNVPPCTVVSTTYRMTTDWSFNSYMARNFNICLKDRTGPEYDFFIEENMDSIPLFIKTEKVNIPTIKYNLYKIIK